MRVVVADDSMFCGKAGSVTCSTTGWRRWTRSAPSQQAGGAGPELVAQLLVARQAGPAGGAHAAGARCLRLMAEGSSNAAIVDGLVIMDGAVEKPPSNIFAKINLPDLSSDTARVLAVLTWLKAR